MVNQDGGSEIGACRIWLGEVCGRIDSSRCTARRSRLLPHIPEQKALLWMHHHNVWLSDLYVCGRRHTIISLCHLCVVWFQSEGLLRI